MKKLVMLMVAMLMVAGIEAQAKKGPKGPQTKEEYLAAWKAKVEGKGEEYNQKKAERAFKKIDTNGDGVASVEEMVAFKEARAARKAEQAAKENAGSEE
jgi:hypothetical protein